MYVGVPWVLPPNALAQFSKGKPLGSLADDDLVLKHSAGPRRADLFSRESRQALPSPIFAHSSARLYFGVKSLPHQPANGLRAGRLIGLGAAPVIDGLFMFRAQPKTQHWILPGRGPPAFFS
jgi:hypothetical protein